MKNRLQILLLFVSVLTYGQKTLKDFSGTLIFKETNFYEPLTRELTDTTINYFSFDIGSKDAGSQIEIQQVYSVKNESREYYFVKFKFIKRHDSLFIGYRDPLQNKDVSEYIYPLNKRDTVNNRAGYKMCFDSILNADHKYRKEFNDCDDPTSFDNTYLKDTTITFKEYKFDCYVIEQNYDAVRNLKLFKKRVFIDKISLIPVYEDEKIFAKRKSSRIPYNKWVLIRQMKLITVD